MPLIPGKSDTLLELRGELQRRFPTACRESWLHQGCQSPTATHWLPAGAVTEWVCEGGSARALAGLAAERRAQREAGTIPAGVPMALIDAGDGFDPASQGGETCREWLWVRCRDAHEALRAADMLMQDGNLDRVVLDATGLPEIHWKRCPGSVWHRLHARARAAGTSLLALTPAALIPKAAVRYFTTTTPRLTDFSRAPADLALLPGRDDGVITHTETATALSR